MKLLFATLALLGVLSSVSYACPPGQQKVCQYNPYLHRYMCWCA